MRLRFGRRSIPSSGTPYLAPEDTYGDPGPDRLEAERDAAVKAAVEMAEGVRAALMSAGYFHVGEGVVAAVQHMAGEYVQTVADYRALKARYERVASGGNVEKLVAAVDAYSVRSGRSESADLEQERANNAALSQRLEQMRREKEAVEQENAELRREAAIYGVMPS